MIQSQKCKMIIRPLYSEKTWLKSMLILSYRQSKIKRWNPTSNSNKLSRRSKGLTLRRNSIRMNSRPQNWWDQIKWARELKITHRGHSTEYKATNSHTSTKKSMSPTSIVVSLTSWEKSLWILISKNDFREEIHWWIKMVTLVLSKIQTNRSIRLRREVVLTGWIP